MILATNEEVFDCNLIHLVDFKWEQSKFWIILEGVIYFCYYFWIGMDSAFFTKSIGSKIAALILTVFMILYEAYQMYFGGLKKYFTNFWKIIDLGGEICLIIYLSYKIRFLKNNSNYDQASEYSHAVAILFMLLGRMVP